MGTPEDPEDEGRAPLSPMEGDARAEAPSPAATSGVLEPATREPASLAFPLRREAVNLSQVMSRASEAWSSDIGTWVLAMFLCLIIGIGVPFFFGALLTMLSPSDPSSPSGALFSGLGAGVQILQAIIQGILFMGVFAMAIHALHGGPAQVGKLFSQAQKIWKYLIQSFLVSVPLLLLAAVVAGIAYAVSGIDLDSPMDLVVEQMAPTVSIATLVATPFVIYALLGVAFGVPELVFNDDAGPLQALRGSWRIARGKRWLMMGVLSIAWLIAFGSTMLCGVGALFGFPFALLMSAALYLGLRNGADDVPEARTSSTLDRPTAAGS